MIRPPIIQRRVRKHECRPAAEQLEDRQLLTALIALAENTLYRFDSATPGTIQSTLPITGLLTDDNVDSIDFRPATGRLYATALNTNTTVMRLYTIDLTATSAVATPLAGTFGLGPTRVGTDFNPVTDKLHIVNRGRQNFDVDPTTGQVAAAGLNLQYNDTGGGVSGITTTAFDNNIIGATSTTLFGVDVNTGKLVTIGSRGGTPLAPSSGNVTPFGVAFLPPPPMVSDTGGFDIAADGTAFFVLDTLSISTSGFTNTLFTLDVTNGTIASGLGAVNLPNALAMQDMAVVRQLVDTTPPTVSQTVQTLITTSSRRRSLVTGFQLQFSEAMEPTRANDATNYLVQLTPRNRRGHFQTLTLRQASYNATNHTVILSLASSMKLDRVVRITVNGLAPSGLTDLATNLLDGDRNGSAGGNAILSVNPKRR